MYCSSHVGLSLFFSELNPHFLLDRSAYITISQQIDFHLSLGEHSRKTFDINHGDLIFRLPEAFAPAIEAKCVRCSLGKSRAMAPSATNQWFLWTKRSHLQMMSKANLNAVRRYETSRERILLQSVTPVYRLHAQ